MWSTNDIYIPQKEKEKQVITNILFLEAIQILTKALTFKALSLWVHFVI